MNYTVAPENNVLTLQEIPVVPTNPAKKNKEIVQKHQQEARTVARHRAVTARIFADSWLKKSAFITEPGMRLR